MATRASLIWSAKAAIRTALIVFFGVIAVSVLRALLGFSQPGGAHFDWDVTFRYAFVIGAVTFIPLFVLHLVNAAQVEPALDILAEGISPSDLENPPMAGFVAMEYYGLIMNRTYVVFIAPEGLYGWMAHGPVAATNRAYFEPYQQMLREEQLTRNRKAIQKLSQLSGGFVLDRIDIASVTDSDRRKWGMGGLPHSGSVRVRLVSGKSREFILLGRVTPGRIRHKIISILGVRATSVAQAETP